MITYKKGAFLNIVSLQPAEWERRFKDVERLPFRDHLEIWLEYIPSRGERAALKGILRDSELIIHGPFIHLSLVSHIPAVAKLTARRLEEAIDLAADLGASVITFHAGTYPVFEDRRRALETLAERFLPFVSLTSPVVTLENMPVRAGGAARECLGRLEDLEEFQKLVPDTRFTLDVGHCLQNEDDPMLFITRNFERIEDIHLHDGRAGGKSHLRLGLGTLDLKSLIETLIGVEFHRYVSLETLSASDTKASWDSWLDAERQFAITKPASFRAAMRS